jgi:hypothetical protein
LGHKWFLPLQLPDLRKQIVGIASLVASVAASSSGVLVMTTNTAGIPGDNSEINMAVRSGVPVAMDDAIGRSTATLPGDVSVLGNFDMGETSLDFSISPSKGEGMAAAPPASRQRRGEAPAMLALLPAAAVRKRPSSA